jgi:inner membrane protein
VRWFNHVAVAGSISAVIDPGMVPLAMLGSTAPDWMEWVGTTASRKVKHRTVTHVLLTWLTAAAFFLLVWDFRGWGAAFTLGAICHWLQDSLTVTGVPVSWWSDRRTTLLGGRMRTGGMGEYILSGVVVLACGLAVFMFRAPDTGFVPFFRNWPELYREGIVDGAEWRARRFEWF